MPVISSPASDVTCAVSGGRRLCDGVHHGRCEPVYRPAGGDRAGGRVPALLRPAGAGRGHSALRPPPAERSVRGGRVRRRGRLGLAVSAGRGEVAGVQGQTAAGQSAGDARPGGGGGGEESNGQQLKIASLDSNDIVELIDALQCSPTGPTCDTFDCFLLLSMC